MGLEIENAFGAVDRLDALEAVLAKAPGIAPCLAAQWASGHMMLYIAQADGTWLGYNASIETITGQFGPFILALIYEGLDATKGTTQIMLICAGISGVSTLMAIQTVIWFPPQCKKKTVREVTPYLCVGLTEERDGKGSGLLKKENALIIDAYNTRFTAI